MAINNVSQPQQEQQNQPHFGVTEFMGSACAAIATLGGAALAQIVQRKELEKEYWESSKYVIEKILLPFNEIGNELQQKLNDGLIKNLEDMSGNDVGYMLAYVKEITKDENGYILHLNDKAKRYNKMIFETIPNKISIIRETIDPRILWGGIALAATTACLTGYIMMQFQEQPDNQVIEAQQNQKIKSEPQKTSEKMA